MSGSFPVVPEQQRVLLDMQLPQIVVNGYSHTHSASEITSLLSFGPRPIAQLIMAPVAAKSFALSLLETVKRYETATNTIVETISELNERITAHNAEGKS